MATPKKTKTPTTKKVVSGSTSTVKKSTPAPQKVKVETPAKSVKAEPVLEKTTREQAYLGLSIALTGVLYFILLFLTYVYFNYDIMLFPKA